MKTDEKVPASLRAVIWASRFDETVFRVRYSRELKMNAVWACEKSASLAK